MGKKRSINEINRKTAGTYGYYQDDGYDYEDDYVDNEYYRDSGGYTVAAKRKGRTGKTVLIAVVAVLVVILGTGTAFGLYMNHIGNELNKGDKTDEELLDIQDTLKDEQYRSTLTEPFYMMLLGADARPGEEMSRSDTNILVRVDPKKDQVSMLSIPRDTKIDLGDNGIQKFNAAYAFEKVPGVIRATEDLVGIKVAHYAEVSFLELKGLVDAIGGVTVDVDETIDDFHCDDGDGNHYVIQPGTQKLSGGEALTFARCRQYADGDFTRQSHQRQLIQAIIDEVLASPITKIPGIIEAGAKCVTTDLSIMDIIGLAQQFADNQDITIYSAMLPSYTQNINGISFVINDEEKTAEMIDLFKAGKDPSGIVSTKWAADIYTNDIDTSKVIHFADDDDYVSPTSPKPNANNSANASTATATTTADEDDDDVVDDDEDYDDEEYADPSEDDDNSESGSGTGSGSGTSTGSGTGTSSGTGSGSGTGSSTEKPSASGQSGTGSASGTTGSSASKTKK